MKFSHKLILFVLCLAGLIAFQVKVVMPLAYEVASSDLFLEDDEDTSNADVIPDQMLNSAFNQCNNYIANDLDSDVSASFTSKPINAWNLSPREFVINADIDLTPTNAQSFTRRYVCRIKFTGEHEFGEITNSENWTVYGISGLENM